MVRDKFHYTMFAASSLVDLEISKFRKLCNLSRILLNTYGNNQTTSRDSRALRHGLIPTLVYQVLWNSPWIIAFEGPNARIHVCDVTALRLGVDGLDTLGHCDLTCFGGFGGFISDG